jgi:hypothetical protein
MRRRDSNPRGTRKTKIRWMGSARSRAMSVPLARLPKRSSEARTKALHVKAAMVRDPKLSLSRAAKSEGVSVRSVRQYFPTGFQKVAGRWRANKADRFREVMYVPDEDGNHVPVPTRGSKERAEVSAYLRALGRFYRDKKSALADWHGKSIAGVPLVTDARALKRVEDRLSDFAIYFAFNGSAE